MTVQRVITTRTLQGECSISALEMAPAPMPFPASASSLRGRPRKRQNK
jgi:hypothetical protein